MDAKSQRNITKDKKRGESHHLLALGLVEQTNKSDLIRSKDFLNKELDNK